MHHKLDQKKQLQQENRHLSEKGEEEVREKHHLKEDEEGYLDADLQPICKFASNMLFAYLKLLLKVAAKFFLIITIIATTWSTLSSSSFAYGLPVTATTIAVVGDTTIVSNVDPHYEGLSFGNANNVNSTGNGSVVIGARSLAAAAAGAAAAYAAGVSMARSSSRSDHAKAHNHDSLSHNSNGQSRSNNYKNELLANSANLLLEGIQHPTGYIVNLTRHHDGDVFLTHGVTTCNADTCVGLSSGTAGLMRLQNDRSESLGSASATLAGGSNSQLELLTRRFKKRPTNSLGDETCECRCLSYLSTYREDLGICVDDIHECTLSPFVSGSSSEKIPFVFLPLRGQIIYPSREISFPDIHTPVCAVTSAQYLTSNGWSELRNPIDTDYPFRMFRDEGRSFIQWLGENDLRKKMQGRLIVVHLVCRDMMVAFNATLNKDLKKPPKNVFSPCVAFRVNGSPVKYENNVSEVLFQAETTATLSSSSDGMSTKEYIVIGVCSLLLGLIYVSSVFLYLHMKKRKNRDQNHHMRNSLDDLATEINYPKNDQVTFGVPFHRSGSLYSANSMGTSNEPRSRASIGSLKEEMGIVKSNPLLQHFPQLNEHNSGFTSDISNSASECEMDGSVNNFHQHEKMKKLQTSVMVHPQMNMSNHNNGQNKQHHQSNSADEIQEMMEQNQETECLPQENVAIVEDLLTEEKLENLRAMVNGNVRKKLYFNPAYFEPHLLAQPPPAAIEFLQKIREVIAIAKYKMATKRYQPSLSLIPEEGALRSNTPSIYGSQMQKQSSECQGCANNRCNGHAKNCGDKRNTIEKWLESVPLTENRNGKTAPPNEKSNENSRNESPRKSPAKTPVNNHARKSCSPEKRQPSLRKEISPPKERPPPPPVPGSKPSNSKNISNGANGGNSSSFRKLVKPHSYPSPSGNNKGSAISIPVNKNFEAFSALTTAANIYGFAETGGEIYNNPKFVLNDSPAASQRSRSSSHRSRKRLDVLDHFASASTPTSLNSADRQHYDMLRNMKHGPEVNYDSMPRDYTATMSSNGSFHLDIPTPDYDSTIEKKIKDIYNSTHGSIPPVPTPDYSTLSRKSLKQFQPDSPIYRRKSPQYLIVDYETDSLERLEATKRKSSHSSSSPSSDVSSQMSPSLSTALPLEEELEISHTVYDKINGFRKEGEVKKKLVAKPEERVAKQKEIAARIKYDTPFRGSMTIEVEHEPPSDLERSTDSDQFEPDTLDRKPKKQSFCDVKAWRGSSQSIYSESEYSQLNSMPDMSQSSSVFRNEPQYSSGASFVLKATNSFRSQGDRSNSYESHVEMRLRANFDNLNESSESFSQLRDMYESPLVRQNSQNSCKCGGPYSPVDITKGKEQSRILALEAKHSRRQRLSEQTSPPPVVEITKVGENKTTIKISTPKATRAPIPFKQTVEPNAIIEPQVHQKPEKKASQNPKNLERNPSTKSSKPICNSKPSSHPNQSNNPGPASCHSTPANTLKSNSSSKDLPKRRIDRSSLTPPPPPPPPPPTSASTTLNSEKSRASSKSGRKVESPQPQFGEINSAFDEEVMSEHSQATEMTRISDNLENSRQNTLKSLTSASLNLDKQQIKNEEAEFAIMRSKHVESPQSIKKFQDNPNYSEQFNQKLNALRNDYSLNKYLNRRKSQSPEDEPNANENDSETNNNNNNMNMNTSKISEAESNKLDGISISSRSNRSSSRLSDRTKEMYRNAGVPVGIAYPQRSSSSASSSTNQVSTTSVQATVYRCEIEPVQLTQGMQIAMGLKDRAKKAKDLKNAWKKFVSKAAAKFSPTQSPAPPFDKKQPSFLEMLDRDEGISSLIDDNALPPSSTPKSSYSAPASQNYYEQRFGGGFSRLGEMDSGYMSADSAEVYKRSFYDRYNFKMRSGRDQIIRVDTIEDNSDGGSTLTDRPNGSRRGSILDDNRFADLEHMESPSTPVNNYSKHRTNDSSDTDSDRTLTRNDVKRSSRASVYSSEDEQAQSTCASSETDGETNAEDMWESGAESIETHSVLYKNVRKT